MESRFSSPARNRAEDRVLFIVMPLIILELFLAVFGFGYHHFQPTGMLAFLYAILITLPTIAFIVIYGLYLAEEKDEFQRTVLVQSMLWGIGATLIFTTFWGLLENSNLVPHLPMYWAQVPFYLFTAIATAVNRWRYR
ncbi:MAG: hypothetical protein ACLQGT_11025 [Terracidiphilus sp.]